MGDKLEVKIITKSGKTHMLTITRKEYEELLSLIDGDKNYVIVEIPTADVIFTKDSIETMAIYIQ